MALVTSLEALTKERTTVHRPTRCFYAIVKSPDGDRYLQLDTIGSNEREMRDKISQSIQFDRQAAGQLFKLLIRTFPDIAEEGASTETAPADPDAEAFEGRILIRRHRSRERNHRLARLKKRSALQANGSLRCEVCNFEFERVYGPIGRGFAECHHRTPLAELDESSPTRLSDLAIVCANCHRMLHRRPFPTVEGLRESITGNLDSPFPTSGADKFS